MTNDKIIENNGIILSLVSQYINECADAIDEGMVKETVSSCGVSEEEAYKILLSGCLDIYSKKELREYINLGVKRLDADVYRNDEYYRNIKLSDIKGKNWSIEIKSYKPYELFCRNDLKQLPDGRIIPQLGYFPEEYVYPCILQDNREWMLITPNEMDTSVDAIKRSRGRVLTYGLGMGYFAYMASNKKEVTSVTIVENDKEVISLFNEYILPQFPNKDKIEIICGDAILHASDMKVSREKKFDFVFADIWHDASDGVGIYEIFKGLERHDTEYSYWIEDTIKCYL